MIIFRSIKYKNFLSTGAAFTKFDLNKSKTTLLCGDNGSGKSILLDALTYVLFNKSFRRINKPQLVNSNNKKESVVEIEFSIHKNNYKVIRGQKPVIFEIYKNGDLIEQTAELKDYQNILEKNILKMNYKTFCQVVILGTANFVPFMMLPAAGRREIIEGLLDIELFSVMNSIVKENLKLTEEELSDLETRQKLLENTIKLNIKHNKQLEKLKNENLGQLIKEIAEYEDQKEQYLANAAELQRKIDGLKVSDSKEIDDKYAELKSEAMTLDMAISTYENEINFYESNDSCSTCNQVIDEVFKTTKLKELKKKRKKAVEDVSIITIEMEKLNGKKIALNKKKDKRESLLATHNSLLAKVGSLDEIIDERSKHQEKVSTTVTDVVDDTKERDELRALLKTKKQYVAERDIDQVAALLLKDNGIKSQIIRQYIPMINQMINTNLAHLEFFCMFEFDENFDEVIKSRYRDDFSYSSFSQGERMRIDLALLFSFRELARMRNASPCNLLILDEVMDSSLDAQGTEEFLKIINTFADKNNIFIISHKHHQITDKFNDVIRIEKKKNFSRKIG